MREEQCAGSEQQKKGAGKREKLFGVKGLRQKHNRINDLAHQMQTYCRRTSNTNRTKRIFYR